MHFNIEHLIHQYGYFGVFVILLLEMIGVPFPAETTLVISGYEWMNGAFVLTPLLIAAIAGNITGSSIAYGIGRYLGRSVILRFGRYVGMTEQRLNKAHEHLEKNRIWILIFSKFIAGVRVFVPYIAGMNRMSFLGFTIYNTISAVIWVTLFTVLGRYIHIGWHRYHHALQRFLVPGIVFIIILGLCYLVMKYRRRRGKTK